MEQYASKLAQGLYKPPMDVWHRIEHQLDTNRAAQRKANIVRLFIAGGIVALLSIGITQFASFIDRSENHLAVSNSFIGPVPYFDLSASNTVHNGRIANISVKNDNNPISPVPSVPADTIVHSTPNFLASQTIDCILCRLQHQSCQPISQEFPCPKYQKARVFKKNVAPLQRKNSNAWKASASASYNYTNFFNYSNTSQLATKGVWQFAGEILARKKLNDWLSFQTGVAFNPIGSNSSNAFVLSSSNPNEILKNSKIQLPFGTVGLKNAQLAIANYEQYLKLTYYLEKNYLSSSASIYQNLYYIEFPVFLSANASKLGFNNISTKFGFAPGVMIANHYAINSDFGKFEGSTEIEDKMSYSIQASLEYSHPVSNKFCLLFEPSFKYNMWEGAKDFNYGTYPITFQLKIGVALK